MSDSAIAEEMKQLAASLAETAPELDYSLDSLTALETLAKKKPRTAAMTRACGAYLGETLRRQAPELVWVSFATASKANAMIAKLTRGPDLDALLQVGAMFWFPLSKVEKFQANGASDSLKPFASTLLATLPRTRFTPEQDEAERQRLLAAKAHVEAAMEAFRKAPTPESMAHFERMLFGHVAHRNMPETFSRLGLEARMFTPFLGVPAAGRGYKRVDYGGAAASLLMQLIAQGPAPRDATLEALRALLTSSLKDARRNAAQVLTYCDLTLGSTDAFLTLAASRDRNVQHGALTGLRSVTSDWRMDYATPKFALAQIAPTLRTMLAPKSPHLAVALGVVRTWGWHRAQRHEFASIADALLPLLDHPKRDTARHAREATSTYLLAILHGDAPRDAAFEAKLAKRKDGFGGPTLSKICAK